MQTISTTLVATLRRRVVSRPNALAFRFLHRGEDEADTLSYAELDQHARTIAVYLGQYQVSGRPVLLLYPPSLEYLCAFFGCLYAEAIAVPAYPPTRHHARRLAAIIDDAKPVLVLCDSEWESKLKQMTDPIAGLDQIPWLPTNRLDIADADHWQETTIAPESLAFLQYTSGSTGNPKGVMVSHANLCANFDALQHALPHPDRAPYVSWLPLYHDMGLIGCALRSIHLGAPAILMSPAAFMEKPVRWLRAISKYGAHISGGPNFAYDLCVDKIRPEDCEGLDLSTWHVAFNGSEPVQAETLKRFSRTFEPYGFRQDAFFPCYGLAESTLFVSGGHIGRGAAVKTFQSASLASGEVQESVADGLDAKACETDDRNLVSCGTAKREQSILIVDPDSCTPRKDGRIGEIWTDGPSIAQGYWYKPDALPEIFAATLSANTSEGFLRTGDLGFIFQGQLFITGRRKDLIVIRGLNYHPQDFEQQIDAAGVTGIRRGCSVAFSKPSDAGEALVVVCELDRALLKSGEAAHHKLTDEIRAVLRRRFALQPDIVVLTPPATIPKTSSGKQMRRTCREMWLAQNLPVVFQDPQIKALSESKPQNVESGQALLRQMLQQSDVRLKQKLLLQYCRAQISCILGVSGADIHDEDILIDLGLDSLRILELKHGLEEVLGREIALSELIASRPLSELVEALLLVAQDRKRPLPIVNEAQDNPEVPLSEGQKALWFVHRQQRESVSSNIHMALRIHSPLNVARLNRCITQLVQEHEALRTAYGEHDGAPYQRVLSNPELDFSLINVRALSKAKRLQLLLSAIAESFTLEQGEVLRVRVLQDGEQETTLLLCAHHIALDFWSLVLIFKQIGDLYTADLHGRRIDLPKPSGTYLDFVRWQQQEMALHGEAHWDYWRGQLAGELPILQLPMNRARPATPRYQGASQPLRITPSVTLKLKTLAKGQHTTLFVTLLAAFSALLHRYSGQEDMIVGTPTSGRSDRRFSDTVGYFVNPVALRLHPKGALRFSDLLSQARETVLSSLRHQDYPFSCVVERLNPTRDANRWPLYQVAFTLQTSHLDDQQALAALALGEAGVCSRWGEMSIESLTLDERIENFDLKLVMAEADGGLSASFQYNSDLFDSDTLKQMAKHFGALLSAVSEQPDTPLRDFVFLDDAERKCLAQTWGRGPEPDGNITKGNADLLFVHKRIEYQAEVRPQVLAVSDGEGSLCYGELNRDANRLAHWLIKVGVGTELVVAIALPRSRDFVLAALSALKAGGAYLPLDMSYPDGRLETMLAEAGVSALITCKDLAGRLPACRTPVITLDDDYEQLQAYPNDNPEVALNDGNLAYLIYTSGSTGRPKGVQVTHRALCNLIDWHRRVYAIGPEDRASQIAASGFDASVWEIWPYLAVGASLHIVSDEVRLEPAPLLGWLKQQAITHCFLPTPLAEALLQLDWPDSMPLKALLTGGDRLGAVPLPPKLRLFNHYGPTENAVVTTCVEVKNRGQQVPSIGRPIDGVQVYILDHALNPVPAGVEGDLYIGGGSLARGYHHRASQTAERFIPDPFSPQPGGRLYRSGDLACYRSDGCIDFKGRIDQQIKLRGVRIELGEIEQVLNAQAEVGAAAVSVCEDTAGNSQLVAYIIPVDDDSVFQENSHLAESQVEAWSELYENTYGQTDKNNGVDFNIVGWNSSFTGAPLPEDEMRAWVMHTVDAILALKPRKILEVGCGTGLLLTRLVQACQSYHATDISQQAINLMRTYVAEKELKHVCLEKLHADVAPDLKDGKIDTLVLNSVVQYFPDSNYLLRVLDVLVPLIEHGHLFIGDVRNLCLLSTFHAEVQLHKSKPSLTLSALAKNACHNAKIDNELCIDPSFFIALKQRFKQITQVSLRHKRGTYRNELNCYRYDAVLSISDPAQAFSPDWQDWPEGNNLGHLSQYLEDKRPACLAFRGIPNARLARAVALECALTDAEQERPKRVTVADLCRKLETEYSNDATQGIDPEALCRLGEMKGYRVDLLLSESGPKGVFDAVFRRGKIASHPLDMAWKTLPSSVSNAAPRRFTNDPMRTRCLNACIPKLREALAAKLPEPMLPSAYVFLEQFPLTANGKLDRKALPAPDLSGSAALYIAPRNVIEKALTAIWSQVLGVSKVGIHDNFFDLGGDSILSMQVVSRAREQGIQLSTSLLFEHQTIEILAQALDTDVPQKSGKNTTGADHIPLINLSEGARARIQARLGPIEDLYPLAPLQAGLWFQSQFDHSTPVYIEQLRLKLEGRINVDALHAAWRLLQVRHAVLRTAFDWIGEETEDATPVQIVLPAEQVELPFFRIDWRMLGPAQQDAQLKDFLAQDYNRGFDVAHAPLMRITLIQLKDLHYRLIWTHHHLLLDGWSVSHLLSELFTAYRSIHLQKKPSLPQPVSFRDYLDWLARQDRETALHYWRQSLAGFEAPVKISKRYGEKGGNSDAAEMAEWSVDWEEAMSDDLKTFCKKQRLTCNTLMQAAWGLLLHLLSGRRDLVFGIVVANRHVNVPGINSMVGLLINSLPLRIRIAPEMAVSHFLQALQTQTQEMAEQGFIPLPEIQRCSDVPAGTPLFDTLLAFENYPLSDLKGRDFEGLVLKEVDYRDQTDYDLTLVVTPGERLHLRLGYDCARFKPDWIEDVMTHFQNLVLHLLDHPAGLLADATALRPDQQQALVRRCRPRKGYPLTQNLVTHFMQQVVCRGSATSLSDEKFALTYAELNEQANRLAQALISEGVRFGSRVALCLERTVILPVAILAVLKTGAAYIPLDPHYPASRLRFCVEDAEAGLIVVDRAFPWTRDTRIPCLSLEAFNLNTFSASPPAVEIHPDAEAYVIYTSGSTGQPKGVSVSHAQVLRLFSACAEVFRFEGQDVWTLFHSAAFDFSVWELWGAWLNGAHCVLIPYWVTRSPQDFQQWLKRHKVTVLSQTPSAFYPLIETILGQPDSGLPLALRYVVFGGEALNLSRLKPWFKRFGDRKPQLVNMYGITETTVHVTARLLHSDDAIEDASLIGAPLSDLSAWVLDAHLNPLPVGLIGEMYVGGAGVAQGYVGRASLTSERFVPDPFSGRPGARLYRSGDLAATRADGTLEYHGRRDAQIQHRGFRIETGEIEHALCRLPGIREAAVQLWQEQGPGDKRTQLAAYLVGEAVGDSELKTTLAKHLPEHMIPGAFMWLDKLPVTVNGKRDKRALPKPTSAVGRDPLFDETTHSVDSAVDSVEQKLMTIWAKVLKCNTLRVTDNFFELGGDSILSMQVVHLARQTGIDISPKQLFETQNVRALAQMAQSLAVSAPGGESPALPASGDLPLTPIQHWLLEQKLPQVNHWNQTVLLKMEPARDTKRLADCLTAVVAHHDSFRLRFKRREVGWRQFYVEEDAASPLEVVDLSTLDMAEQNDAIATSCERAQKTLDITRGPVLRACYFSCGSRQSDRLLLTVHHLVMDGVSWRIFLEDLERAYRDSSAGKEITLPVASASFKHWAEELKSYAKSPAAKAQLAYWRALPWSSVSGFPCDDAEADNTEAFRSSVTVHLESAATQALLQQVPMVYGTRINDLLLCALAHSLIPWSGAEVVHVDVEGHGREGLFSGADVSRSVGWFTSQYPVLLRLSSQGPGEEIKRVKEYLRAIPQNGVGFGVLRYLGDAEAQAALHYLPRAQVSFNYLGQFDTDWADSSPLFTAPEDLCRRIGPQHGGANPCFYDIDINAVVVAGRLSINWAFGPRHTHRTIETLAHGYMDALRTLIAHCLGPGAGGLTPSDFPLVEALDQSVLDELLDTI